MPKRSEFVFTKDWIEKAKPGVHWDARCPGLGIRVSLDRRIKTFIVQFRDSGGRQRKPSIGRYNPTEPMEAVRDLARSTIARRGDPTAERKTERDAKRVSDLLDFYCGPWATQRQLDSQTVTDAKAVMRLYVPAKFMQRRIVDVDHSDILRVVGDALLTGQRRDAERVAVSRASAEAFALEGRVRPVRKPAAQPGVAQANRLIAILSKLFELPDARKALNGASNPVSCVEKYHQDERWRNFSAEEVRLILLACDAHGKMGGVARDASDAVRLLLFTGARLQEVLSAPWSQFDLERGLWTKPSAATKSNTQHLLGLDLDGPAMAVLRELRARNDAEVPGDLRLGQPQRRGDNLPKHLARMDRPQAGEKGVGHGLAIGSSQLIRR
jgi:integrase